MFRWNETTYADGCSCMTSQPTTELEGPLSSRRSDEYQIKAQPMAVRDAGE